MRTIGWIFVIFGGLSLLGCLSGGTNPTGPLFWLGLGIFLVYRSGEKKKEEKDKDKWINDEK